MGSILIGGCFILDHGLLDKWYGGIVPSGMRPQAAQCLAAALPLPKPFFASAATKQHVKMHTDSTKS
eukprot:2749901-Amphidinium_carterae.1